MDAWLTGIRDLFSGIFFRPTPSETGTLIACCVLFGALALSRTGTALGAVGAFYTTGVFLVPIGLALTGAAMALPPAFGFHDVWLSLAAAALMLLAVVLPLTVFFQKGSYVTALIAWILALLAVGAVLTVEPTIKRIYQKGVEKTGAIEKYRIETERFR